MKHVKGNGRKHKKFQVDRLRFLTRIGSMNFAQDLKPLSKKVNGEVTSIRRLEKSLQW